MPADGTTLPIKRDFGTSRRQLFDKCYTICPRARKAYIDVAFLALSRHRSRRRACKARARDDGRADPPTDARHAGEAAVASAINMQTDSALFGLSYTFAVPR